MDYYLPLLVAALDCHPINEYQLNYDEIAFGIEYCWLKQAAEDYDYELKDLDLECLEVGDVDDLRTANDGCQMSACYECVLIVVDSVEADEIIEYFHADLEIMMNGLANYLSWVLLPSYDCLTLAYGYLRLNDQKLL